MRRVRFIRRHRSAFPPYRLLEHDYLARAEGELARLARIYHVAQDKAWDGREVLSSLVARHGGIRLGDDKKEALARIFAIIMWGELAAWIVAADLVEQVDEVEAKMAATSQVFDEARHFYVLRDYLVALGIEVPELDGFSLAVLVDLLESDSVAYKLLGEQLLVESVALLLFRYVGRARVEPVLADLMPFFERDEARHVGLATLYLPRLLPQLSRREALRLSFGQFRIMALLGWGNHLLRDDFAVLGLDQQRALREGLEYLDELRRKVGWFDPGGSERLRGLHVPGTFMRWVNDTTVDLLFHNPGERVPPWRRGLERALTGMARAAERFVG